MKKLFLAGIMLATASLLQAQTVKVAPQLKAGTVKNYAIDVTTDVAGRQLKTSSEGRYTVSEDTKDGHVIDYVLTDFSSDAGDDNLSAVMLSITNEAQKGVKEQFITDNDGMVKGIKNFDEMKKLMDATVEKTVDAIMEKIPQLGDIMPREKVKEQIMSQMTEEMLINAARVNTSPLALNGKTITTGMEDEYVNMQGMKMKRTYSVDNGIITATSKMNMSRDDLKKMMLKYVESLAPAQAGMIRDNIDAVLDSGMIKFEATETAVYQLADDGWVKSISVETASEASGQKVKMNATVTLK